MSEATQDNFVTEMGRQVGAEVDELGAAAADLDIYFLAYLRRMARFGYFTFGPIHIDVGVIEDGLADRRSFARADA